MSRARKIIALLLLFSLLQAFAPLLRMAMQASCCMAKPQVAAAASCCQKAEQPMAQMKCCASTAAPEVQPALPKVLSPEKNLLLQLAALDFNTEQSLPHRTGNASFAYSSFNPHSNNNHRYLLSAALLL